MYCINYNVRDVKYFSCCLTVMIDATIFYGAGSQEFVKFNACDVMQALCRGQFFFFWGMTRERMIEMASIPPTTDSAIETGIL